jgi:drug/metabolite transporter (DMT)-like permease
VLAALVTACLWTLSGVSGASASRHLGGPTANRLRLTLAMLPLGAWAAWHADQCAGGWFWWFVLSGAVGMGLGDRFLFAGYERIGTRLPILITYCLSGPLAATVEWLTRGVGLSVEECVLCALIVLGVATALVPGLRLDASGPRLRSGLLFSLASALMVGVAAVIIRAGYAQVADHGGTCDGASSSFMRVLGGFTLSWALLPVLAWGRRLPGATRTAAAGEPSPRNWRKAWPGLLGTTLCGPFLGMIGYQIALSGDKAGTVHAVLAIVPILIMPLAWLLEGDRPTRWSILGGALAVGAAVRMALLHAGGR